MTFFVDGIAPHRKVVPPETPGPWWWACSQPERPADGWTMFLTDCAACQMALAALALRDPSSTLDWHGEGTGVPTENITAVAAAERGIAGQWLPRDENADR